MRTLQSDPASRQNGDRPSDYSQYPEDDRDATGAYERLTNPSRHRRTTSPPRADTVTEHDTLTRRTSYTPAPPNPCQACRLGDHQRCDRLHCWGCDVDHETLDPNAQPKHGVIGGMGDFSRKGANRSAAKKRGKK